MSKLLSDSSNGVDSILIPCETAASKLVYNFPPVSRDLGRIWTDITKVLAPVSKVEAIKSLITVVLFFFADPE